MKQVFDGLRVAAVQAQQERRLRVGRGGARMLLEGQRRFPLRVRVAAPAAAGLGQAHPRRQGSRLQLQRPGKRRRQQYAG